MEFTPDLLKILSDGGIPIILFAIWYFTYRQSNENHKQAQEQVKASLEQYQRQLAEVMTQNKQNFDSLILILKEDGKYKAMLNESLTRVQMTLDERKNFNLRRSANE